MSTVSVAASSSAVLGLLATLLASGDVHPTAWSESLLLLNTNIPSCTLVLFSASFVEVSPNVLRLNIPSFYGKYVIVAV